MKTVKIAISIPSEGHTLPEAYDNHLVMAFRLGALQERLKQEKAEIQYEFYWYTAGRLFTPMAREKLVTEALTGGMDYIIMYDDDMLLPLDMVERMLQDAQEHPEIDILAPLAFMRNPPHYAVIYTSIDGYDSERHQPYHINNFVKKYPRNQLVECDAVGFGAVMIKMEMVKKMKSPFFFSTTGTGEDIYFCVKSKQEAGARIFMDTRIKLGHLGSPSIIDESTFDAYIKDHNLEIPDIPHKYLTYER